MKVLSTPFILSAIAFMSIVLIFQNCGGVDPSAHQALHSAAEDGEEVEVLEEEPESLAINMFTPASSKLAGGTKLTVIGSGFLVTDKVFVNKKRCTGVALINTQELTCTIPAVTAEVTVPVTVRRADDSEEVELGGFHYLQKPGPLTIACSPNSPTKRTISKLISFPAVRDARCAFGVGANLTKKDGVVRARREQEVGVTIPSTATICEASIEFERNRFVFNDAFFLTLNGRIFAASNGFINKLSRTSGATGDFIYNWNRVLLSSPSSLYCPSGTCELSGPIGGNRSLHFAPEENFIRNSLGSIKTGQHKFRFIVTGDNDDVDCQHNGLNGRIDVDYDIAQ